MSVKKHTFVKIIYLRRIESAKFAHSERAQIEVSAVRPGRIFVVNESIVLPGEGRLVVANIMSATDDAIIRWTSTGGGWRSMVACMGFGNLFYQAGLLENTSSSSSSSLLSAISTTSGASWYSTQLFYSEAFYEATVMSSANELYDFTQLWLDSYRDLSADLSANATGYASICADLPVDENLQSVCSIALTYGGDWAAFMDDMFLHASTAYGVSDFVTRSATPEGRVAPLQDTDLIIQTALSPTSRIVGGSADEENDTIVYLGPISGIKDTLFSTPIPAAYVVSSSDTPTKGWWYGGVSIGAFNALGLDPTKFSFSDWEDFYLYPGENGTVRIPNDSGIEEAGVFQDPFTTSGGTNVIQAASTGSALLGPYSGMVPSVFSQTFSVKRYAIQTSDKGLAEKTVELEALDGPVTDKIYQLPLFFGLAVCSQWPSPCGEADSHFLDGLATDTTALSTTIGNYQSSPDADLSKTIKVLLSNNNQVWNDTSNYQQILFHYSTAFNQNIAPSEFLWLKDYNKQPIHSPQIFEEYMDVDSLNSLVMPIEGSNMTTALLKGTTVDNQAFSVVAGQSVEILLINVNEPIPTMIAGPSLINAVKGPMGDMAVEIATNPELLARVEAFLSLDGKATDNRDSDDTSTTNSAALAAATALTLLFSMSALLLSMFA